MEKIIIAFLTGLGYDIHLTGSRYFGGAREDSDYDFFVPHSPQLETALASVGFKFRDTYLPTRKEAEIYSNDPSIMSVAEFNQPGCKIHIQLIKPALFDAKLRAQRIIKSRLSGVLAACDKTQRGQLWRVLIEQEARIKS